jgi:hypothetical protein
LFIRPGANDPAARRGTPTPRDRRLAVVVFRRAEGRRGRVQLDHPGIGDLQPSSSAGPRGGRVACNSTIPGSATCSRRLPPGRGAAGSRATRPSRDRRLAVAVFRRAEGRRGRVQLDHPGNRRRGSSGIEPNHSWAATTQLRPCAFARYMAPSARPSRLPGLVSSGLAAATPMDRLIDGNRIPS